MSNRRSFLRNLFGTTVVAAASTVVPNVPEVTPENPADIKLQQDLAFLDSMIEKYKGKSEASVEGGDFTAIKHTMLNLPTSYFSKYAHKVVTTPTGFSLRLIDDSDITDKAGRILDKKEEYT